MKARWTVHHADAHRSIGRLGLVASRTVVITDPPWPNAPEGMFPGVEPYAEFAKVAAAFPSVARRAVVHLGCNSDPRILEGVPREMAFVRACWLKYARPSYFGTILNTGDVAYVFGSREATDGKTLMPGEVCATDTSDLRGKEHPCPRPLEFVAWLVKWFTSAGDVVFDPFCGSGTTGVAALRAGRDFVGIEKDEKWAALARERLAAEADSLSIQDARAGQVALFPAEAPK